METSSLKKNELLFPKGDNITAASFSAAANKPIFNRNGSNVLPDKVPTSNEVTKTFNFPDGTTLNIGSGNDLSIYHGVAGSVVKSKTSNLTFNNANPSGKTIMKLGSNSASSEFHVENQNGDVIFKVNGTGSINFPTLNTSGAPSKQGSAVSVGKTTFTDSTTSQDDTTEGYSHFGIARPTLNSANNVTTTTASTFYIENAPASGPNQTIINPYSVWVENGNSLFGGDIFTNSVITTSDTRLKTNIKQLTNPLQKLQKINGYSYNWKNKEKGEKEQYGVLAQQLEEEGFGHLVSDNGNNKAVNYLGLIPLIIESMKELKKENENLKQEINEMKK